MARSRSTASLDHHAMRAVHAWLMVLPALALLVAFTHWPAVSTLVDSFFSTPKGARAGVFVGLENYRAMLDDDPADDVADGKQGQHPERNRANHGVAAVVRRLPGVALGRKMHPGLAYHAINIP